LSEALRPLRAWVIGTIVVGLLRVLVLLGLEDDNTMALPVEATVPPVFNTTYTLLVELPGLSTLI
jgi:hypothetical protein